MRAGRLTSHTRPYPSLATVEAAKESATDLVKSDYEVSVRSSSLLVEVRLDNPPGDIGRPASRPELASVQRQNLRATWSVSSEMLYCLQTGHSCPETRSHQDLLKGIYDMGFTKPSKIQERALPLLLSNP